jgi:hypothetical protein
MKIWLTSLKGLLERKKKSVHDKKKKIQRYETNDVEG